MPSTNLHTFTVSYPDNKEFHSLKREIFTQEIYHLDLDQPNPVIVDIGAHIGLASLYFLSQFPLATITAVEPHPTLYRLLAENVWQNQLENQVTTICAAVSTQQGSVQLFADPTQEWLSTASTLPQGWTGQEDTSGISVESIGLSQLLSQPVDLVKLDIEGAESQLLIANPQLLKQAKHWLVEFHPGPGRSLNQLCQLLTQQGFAISLTKNGHQVTQSNATGLVVVRADQLTK